MPVIRPRGKRHCFGRSECRYRPQRLYTSYMGFGDTHQFERYPTRELPRTTAVKQTRRLAVLVLGGSLIALGLALIVLPGPFTIPPVLLGLTVLSWEFGWAKRLLHQMRLKTKQLRTRKTTEL